jgi:hypothetical protein
VCGYANRGCVPPAWTEKYQFGTVVQFYGAMPTECNFTSGVGTCLNNTVCCTQPCEVIGTGVPLWSIADPTNPATGGVQLRYTGVVPDADDYQCDPDPVTGAWGEQGEQRERRGNAEVRPRLP